MVSGPSAGVQTEGPGRGGARDAAGGNRPARLRRVVPGPAAGGEHARQHQPADNRHHPSCHQIPFERPGASSVWAPAPEYGGPRYCTPVAHHSRPRDRSWEGAGGAVEPGRLAPGGTVREPLGLMSPVKERTTRNPRSLALALGRRHRRAGRSWWSCSWSPSPGLTEEGKVEVKLGTDTFTVGQARPQAESVATDGPFLFSDVANGQRDIYVQHIGDDPLTGWLAFDARLPGAVPGLLAGVEGEPRRVRGPVLGPGRPRGRRRPADYPVEVNEAETVIVDLNAARASRRPRGHPSRRPPARSW